jgi:cytochrome c biogenesis protein CcmG/thiol:disulfide interchange protein DsbE
MDTSSPTRRGFAWKTLVLGLLLGLVGGTVGLAALILGAYAFFQQEAVTAMAEQKELEPLHLRADLEWTVTTLDGTEVSMSTFSGQPLLLHFWNPSCVSCLAEIPSLNDLYETFAPAGLQVIAVAIQGDDGLARDVAAHGVAFPVYAGSTATLPAGLRPTAIPTTYLIDRTGFIHLAHRGAADWSRGDTADFLRHWLQQQEDRS